MDNKRTTRSRFRPSQSRYKTRQQEGSLQQLEKSRYTPDIPLPRIRRPTAPSPKAADDAPSHTRDKRRRTEVSPDSSEVDRARVKRPRLSSSSRNDFADIEEERLLLREALADRFPSTKAAENDMELQFKKAIRLYRYMSLPDTQNGVPRPVYRPFLKRNLLYMKTPKNAAGKCRNKKPPLYASSDKASDRPRLLPRQKREHMNRLIGGIYKRKKLKEEPISAETLTDLEAKQATVGRRGIAFKECDKSAPAQSTSVMKFIDVRNKELPGSRHAMITVYMATEVDGSFSEITRLPSATVQMQVNVRSNLVSIDLPRTIGCLSSGEKERNDYVIIRVSFSGEEGAKISGGRVFRAVPSRQAEKAEVKVTRRSTTMYAPKFSREDTVTMYGARCISSVTENHPGGMIYGDGSINLVPETSLNYRNFWRKDRSLTKKLIELGKKMHMGPFVRMSIVQDSGGETSSSDDDDETHSCSSRSLSINGRRWSKSREQSIESSSGNARPSAVGEGVEQFMKARYEHEMSLEFPAQICYRFIMKYNDQPNTSFPENKLPTVPDDPPCLAASASPSDHDEVTRAVKTENGISSPLKEVSKILNCHIAPPFQTQVGKLYSTKNGTNSPVKFRLDPPRRDSPLSDTIDRFAARFDKCSKLVPPKQIDRNDKVTVPELHYENYPEPDGNGVVTRYLSPSNKCFFCLGTFPDMFALLLHMRTSYPRLDIVYKGDIRQTSVINNSAPVYVDVFLRENFDGSFEGPMIRQYLNPRTRVVPQRCLPNDRLTYLVYKSEARAIRRMRKDLSIFFTAADREKRAVKGNNCAYFGFRSRHPLMNPSQVSTKQTDQEWLREFIIRQIEDFVDLSRTEKDFMTMWNIFLLNNNHKPLGRCHMYRTCRLFIQKHRQDLVEKNLENAWIFHLTAFHEKEALDSDEVYDLIMRLQSNYDPERDVRHVVYNTARQRLEAAANSAKRDPPAWQRDPVIGPKISILRSASSARLSSLEPNSDNEEMFKKFINDPGRQERRSSSYSGEEAARQGSSRRQREPDCSKYLVSPRATEPPRWLSFAE